MVFFNHIIHCLSVNLVYQINTYLYILTSPIHTTNCVSWRSTHHYLLIRMSLITQQIGSVNSNHIQCFDDKISNEHCSPGRMNISLLPRFSSSYLILSNMGRTVVTTCVDYCHRFVHWLFESRSSYRCYHTIIMRDYRSFRSIRCCSRLWLGRGDDRGQSQLCHMNSG